MSWKDRIREAAYTSPSGVRVAFTFEDVSSGVDKKTTGFNFPDANGTYVQDLGNTGRRFPLRIIFHGENCDLEATSFEELILEKGYGRLEHPVHGLKTVVPFGAVTRRDDLKSAGNQVVFDITFWETIELVYPLSQIDPSSQVINSIDDFNNSTAQQFENDTDLNTVVKQQKIKGTFTKSLDAVKSGLNKISKVQADVTRQFNNIYNSINSNINTLIGQPLTLVAQTLQLVQSPARVLTSVTARLEAYKNLATNLVTTAGVADPSVTTENSNNFRVNSVYAYSYISGQVLSVVNGTFNTKTEALEAAEEIISLFETVTDWTDDNLDSLGLIDSGDLYQNLQKAVSYVVGYLIQISFTLKQEKIIILDRDRSVIDLCGELYNNIDDSLDFFILSNKFTGSEIMDGISKGGEIVYYV